MTSVHVSRVKELLLLSAVLLDSIHQTRCVDMTRLSEQCFKSSTEVQHFYDLQAELLFKAMVEILRSCLHHFLELKQHGSVKFTKPAKFGKLLQ